MALSKAKDLQETLIKTINKFENNKFKSIQVIISPILFDKLSN